MNAVDAGAALRRVLGQGTFSADEAAIAIDALLLVDDGAFVWRRFAALGEFILEPVELLGLDRAAGARPSSPSTASTRGCVSPHPDSDDDDARRAALQAVP